MTDITLSNTVVVAAIRVSNTSNSTSNPLRYVGSPSTVVSLVADDNQSLGVYDESTYTMSKAVKYLCYLVDGLVLCLFLAGFVAGKLVALEYAAVVQLSFYSLMCLQKLSPTYNALTNLKYSTGYNINPSFSYSSSIESNYKALKLSYSLL